MSIVMDHYFSKSSYLNTPFHLLVATFYCVTGIIWSFLLGRLLLGILYNIVIIPKWIHYFHNNPKERLKAYKVYASSKLNPTLLLIHGTFAGAKSEIGEQWWQTKSIFRENIKEKLSKNGMDEVNYRTFQWSGANSEAERRVSARRLAKLLIEINNQNKPFYIIAHSHGGSILWLALQYLTLKLKETSFSTFKNKKIKYLNNLDGWITMGTPFIKLRVRARNGISCIFWIYVALSLLIIFIWASRFLLTDFMQFYSHSNTEFLIKDFILLSLLLLGVSITSPKAMKHYHADVIRTEQSLEEETAKYYASKWLGIRGRDDEAILGLLCTSKANLKIVPRPNLSINIQIGSIFPFLSRIGSIVLLPMNLSYCYILAPFLDHLIFNNIRRSLQGNDLLGIKVKDIYPSPTFDLNDCLPIPSWIEDKLKDQAEESIKSHVCDVRMFIRLMASGQNYSPNDTILKGNELIHTSYYNQDEIKDIIVKWICKMTYGNIPPRDELDKWICEWEKILSSIVKRKKWSVHP